MALAALELLARREAIISPHVVLTPVPTFSKSLKAKFKGLKEFAVYTRLGLRLPLI